MSGGMRRDAAGRADEVVALGRNLLQQLLTI